ncbi:hypothetical protein [uncultured Microbacterium sp.]|uniref:hypothetical protein n=1 Tax=uncultured Microbacterium sp. TaxID=191216 RepID=UPI0026276A0E|nr:hypothetical protein [uncultured Microbacterium sp.]
MTANGGRRGHGTVALALVVMVGAASLTGCRPQGVDIPKGWENLQPCPQREIRVEDLPQIGKPGCDLAFSTVVFEGDYADYAFAWEAGGGWPVVEIISVGYVTAPTKVVDGKTREVLVVNWGVPGVGVASIEDGKLRAIWATSPEAEDLQYRQLEVGGIVVDVD